MARRAKEPDLAAEQKENQITEALERKRRQVDREIAEFKAEKEHDYRVFERKLRGRKKENDSQDGPQVQRKRARPKQKDAAAEVELLQTEEADDAQRELGLGDRSQKNTATKAEDPSATDRSKINQGRSPRSPTRSVESSHEQEKELQGVCSPSFPLVGDPPADHASRSQEHSHPTFLNSGDVSAAWLNSGTMLSSSAETVHPPMTSPPLPPARPLSSSVPPEKSLHHRTDSSRSDTCIASLRSSLRDPKQPRSPKRVLFSIDDTLVSPSTSPMAQRSKSATPPNPADTAKAVGSTEKFEVVRNQSPNGPTTSKSGSSPFDIVLPSASANSWTASLLTFGRVYDSDLSKAGPATSGADDFEHLENDDLFTFDEDMGRTSKNESQEADLEDECDEDVEMKGKKNDPPTASSPHAGSLPIEIKWPGRREGRG